MITSLSAYIICEPFEGDSIVGLEGIMDLLNYMRFAAHGLYLDQVIVENSSAVLSADLFTL